MLKKIITGFLLFAVMATTTMAFAEDVYVTKRGKKYHKELCRVIQDRDVQKIDDEDAAEKGLTACRRCFHEEAKDNVKKK
jgi:hypothetical protein